MSKTLFLSPPSFDGFDGGAGARYQARREVTSYWYPTWLAQPAALVPDSKLLDCPPHDIDLKKCLAIAKDFNHVIINTSTPSLKNDCKVAEAKAAINSPAAGARGAFANEVHHEAHVGSSCGTTDTSERDELLAKIKDGKKSE